MTQEELKRLLHYDPETGVFTWRVQRGNRLPPGSRAGSVNSAGYGFIRIEGSIYAAHRLAFLYMTGTMPAMVDHINGVRSNNRWQNLRPASPLINSVNRKRPANNRSGHKGVSFVKASGRWHASIRVNGKRKHLGLFATAEEAGAAYRAAAAEHFGEYARVE